jgi:hypothetical protein
MGINKQLTLRIVMAEWYQKIPLQTPVYPVWNTQPAERCKQTK